MDKICVVTSNSRAYYSILSRLRRTGLEFVSRTPGEEVGERRGLVITTRKESEEMGFPCVAIEDLDQSPIVMRGQLLARMSEEAKDILVGVDPGWRTGVAIFYEDTRIGSFTMNSLQELSAMVAHLIHVTPHSGVTVKVGDGDRRLARQVALALKHEIGKALVEIVDEKGTSIRRIKERGLTRDQSAAARIAFRKGIPLIIS